MSDIEFSEVKKRFVDEESWRGEIYRILEDGTVQIWERDENALIPETEYQIVDLIYRDLETSEIIDKPNRLIVKDGFSIRAFERLGEWRNIGKVIKIERDQLFHSFKNILNDILLKNNYDISEHEIRLKNESMKKQKYEQKIEKIRNNIKDKGNSDKEIKKAYKELGIFQYKLKKTNNNIRAREKVLKFLRNGKNE